MKYLVLIITSFFLFGCDDGEAKRLTDKMKPLTAQQQADDIKICESNPGWTAQPVTYRNVVLQIRCVKK